MSIDRISVRASLEQMRITSASSQTPTSAKTKPLLIPEIKTTRNKPLLQLKPRYNSLRDNVSQDGDSKSEIASDVEPDANMTRVKDEHREFQTLFTKFARKVTRLEKAAQEYMNDGAPKRMRQEHKHYSYLFASTLGDFPKLASDDAIDRFVKKMRRFKETTESLVKTCDQELNRFSDQNYYRNDMLVPPLKSLRILQRAVKNCASRKSSDYESDKQDIKFSKLSLFSQLRGLSTGSTPSQLTPEVKSPLPIESPKIIELKPPSPPPQQEEQVGITKLTVTQLPSLTKQEEKKEEQKEEEEVKTTELQKEQISLPVIETSSVLAHSQSFVEDDRQIKHNKIIEELKEDVFEKYLRAMGQSPETSGMQCELKSKFTPVDTSIELNSKYKSEILGILEEYKDLISYKEEEATVVLLSSSKHYLQSATSKIAKMIVMKEEQQYQYDLSDEQALHLKALAQRGFQERIFMSLKVSEVIQDPATRNYFLLFKCQHEEKEVKERKILQYLSRLRKVNVKMSKNVEFLLKRPDLNSPDISTLYKFEQLHHTVLVPRDAIPSDDFEMFPYVEAKSDRNEDEVLSFKTEECANFSYFYALSGSLKDSGGFMSEVRSQLDYWEKYKMTISTKPNCTNQVDKIIGHKWEKTDDGRALQERYNVVFYTSSSHCIAIYGNYSQQRLVHTLICQTLDIGKDTHKEEIEISQKSFVILQGGLLKEIETKLAEHFSGVKVYLHQSHDHFWATISLPKSKNAQIARDIFKKLELDILGSMEYQVLNSEYWSERQRVQEFILSNELQLHSDLNETPGDIEVQVSKASGQGLWMRSHLDAVEELEFYSAEMSQKIEWKFRLLQFFFKIEESTFSIVPGREDTWSEVSPLKQYKLKRISRTRGSFPERLHTLKPREQLIIGSKEEIEALRSYLPNLKHQADINHAISLFIEAPLTLQLLLYIERKYNVILTPSYGTNSLLIEGLLQQEATAQLKRYWNFGTHHPRSLKPLDSERQYILDLLQSRWIGSGALHEIEIIKICKAQKWHNYAIEKSIHERLSPKKEIELAVFQEEEKENSKNLFHYNLGPKMDPRKRISVILFYILIGKKLKTKELRDMKVPPETKASVEKKKHRMNESFDINGSFDCEEMKKVYYDTVEFKAQDEGSLFRVFNQHHIYPTYKISFSVKE